MVGWEYELFAHSGQSGIDVASQHSGLTNQRGCAVIATADSGVARGVSTQRMKSLWTKKPDCCLA